MIDGHAHMDREGLKGVHPALGPVRSIRDIQNRIAELASAKLRGEWIVTMPIGDPPYYFDVPDILLQYLRGTFIGRDYHARFTRMRCGLGAAHWCRSRRGHGGAPCACTARAAGRDSTRLQGRPCDASFATHSAQKRTFALFGSTDEQAMRWFILVVALPLDPAAVPRSARTG
jgi:hypothetical protein